MKHKSAKFKLFLDSIIVNSASLIEKTLFFVVNIIIARYLSIEHFGEYSTALSYATFFSLMTDIGINVTLIRALNLESHYSNEHFTNAFCLKGFLAVTMYMIMAISLYFTDYNRDVIYLTLILGIGRIGHEFMKTYFALDEARQKFIMPSLINSLHVILFLVGTIAVVLYNGNYYHLCWVRTGIVYFFIFIMSIYVSRKLKLIFNKKLYIHFVKTAFPFAMYAVLWNITFRINAIIISLLLGTTCVGIYNISILFIDTLAIVPSNMRRIFMPSLYTALMNGDRKNFKFTFETINKYFGILSSFVMIILFIYAEKIITIIFGVKYYQAATLVKILSLSIPFVFNAATIIIVGLDKQIVLTKILAIATIVNLGVNIVLIKLVGIAGASWSVLITYAIIFIMGCVYLHAYEKLKINTIVRHYLTIFMLSAFVIIFHEYSGLNTIPLFFSFIAIIILHSILVILFLLNKDDLRIVKEIFGFK